MNQTIRSRNLRDTLPVCLLALLLALVLIAVGPAVASAQLIDPGNPGDVPPPPDGPGVPMGPPGGPPGGGNGGDENMGGGGMAAPIPKSNRIVHHAATPVQLVKTGDDGLHLYFIGADGSTYTGPVFSSFAALEEMHPSGAAVSLFDGKNPSTGQPVTVDYLPDENRIFVKTFYPAGHDKYNPHKAYDFTVDDEYKVKHVNW